MVIVSDDQALLDVDIIHGFLKRSHWAANRTRETLVKSIQNSICFGAYLEERQIGFSRVITDRSTFAYLCDVFVDENHRGKGVSKLMMAEILRHPELQNFRRFTLATRNAHGLYAKFGFMNVPADRFMEIKNENV